MVFPTSILASGAITQRPYRSIAKFLTTRVTLDNSVTYAWSNLATPLWEFDLYFASMTAAELAILENFFAAAAGRLNFFSMTDPDGNARATCRFDSDRMDILYVGPGQYSVTLPITEYVG